MALFKKETDEEEFFFDEPFEAAPSAPEKAAPKLTKFIPINKTVIGEDVSFVGEFNAKDPIVINGHVEGDITCTSNVSVGYRGDYNGNANVKSIHVDGLVDGKIYCEENASFTESSTMKGALTTCGLSTDDGAVFEGTLELRPKKPAPKAAETETL